MWKLSLNNFEQMKTRYFLTPVLLVLILSERFSQTVTKK